MPIVHITDLDHPLLADYHRLTDVALRRVLEPEGGLYIAESAKVIERALDAGHRPRSVLVQEKRLPDAAGVLERHSEVPVFVAPDPLIEELTGFHLHRGALASMHRPPLRPMAELLEGARLVVILEDLVDHTNVGAVFRAAAGMGADAVLVTPRCADPLYRRSVRVSMGTVLQVPWTRTPEWAPARRALEEAGFSVAALALAPDAVPLDEYAAARPERVAIVLGAEGDGLSRAALDASDTVVTIPMLHGVDSLNVASASAVALWALTRGR
ncbi:rRNA methyltransferase [Rathayibacter sp. AY1E3]|uniref:TrmH family RNA methyltransferase n=1 Tax=unclassified Rathayibacter TaxID=2609250 RepID=UPI000CE8813E|nr:MULTISPECIES: RNA methyltransferase [unclassified Rathayibacter]PPF12328.1 rRNA methyltransferase [Rathayibacter sp. AY1A5]PPF74169.1 rRNA methyltransferase [Rathayibacter sp. AY1E6]PPH11841.1 rRNA methyltransferase [Rathayibacter sp. AY1C1]PPH23048.1 rRNA methyltransferase [Rathayibacter sp. AY1C4]PPH36923.1 rRNA methyltransferase [Rathayibacter sp. AY1E3]